MKIIEAINKVDELKPNGYSQNEKIAWLSELDGIVYRDVIETHEGEYDEFHGYDENTDTNTELLIYEPYTEAYVNWLFAKIDYNNGEYAKHNNSITKFKDSFTGFSSDYNRHNMPKGKQIKYY